MTPAAPFDLLIDPVLLRKYDREAESRHQVYPRCDFFVEAFDERDARDRLAAMRPGGRAFSAHLHLPSCETNCRYSGCARIPAPRLNRLEKYIKCLAKEIELAGVQGVQGAAGNVAVPVHLRCAVPDALRSEALAGLARSLRTAFGSRPATWTADIEASRLAPGHLGTLAALGFTGLSMLVDERAGRVKRSERARDALARIVEEAQQEGFRTLGFHLVYGQPGQTMDAFGEVLSDVIAQAPEKITLQRQDRAEADGASAAAGTLAMAVGSLANGGYVHLGMGTFGKPDSELATAKAQGRLCLGPDGYSVLPQADTIGLGVSSISSVGASYWQNVAGLDEYCAALEAGRLPVRRGLDLSADDLVRRAVMHALVCNGRVSIEAIESAHLIEFQRHFAAELEALRDLANEGLVDLEPDWIVVTPQGKLAVGAVCEVFDRRMRARLRRDWDRQL